MAKITIVETKIKDLVIIEPTVFGDERGYFLEAYNQEEFKEAGIDVTFIQDNESKSKKGVLRGLHFQTNNPQGKLVRVIHGEVFDVAVDLRKNSPTYGKWEGIYLSGEMKNMLYVPPGFAHGFLVTSEEATLTYKCTSFYDSISDSGICYNDPEIGINWPIEDLKDILLSDKDKALKTLNEMKIKF